MFSDIFSNFFDTFFINFRVILIKIDKPSKTVLSLEDTYLVMDDFNLFSYKLSYIYSLFSIIDLKIFVFGESIIHQFFFKIVKKNLDFFEDLLFVLHQLIMNAFS